MNGPGWERGQLPVSQPPNLLDEEANMTPYKIILADDQPIFLRGIRNIIEDMEGVQISGEAHDGSELVELLNSSTPDLIILDLAMSKMRGLELLREVKKRYPRVKIVILTTHCNKDVVRKAISGGADGYILKEESDSELIQAINHVRSGKKYFSPPLSEVLFSLAKEEKRAETLTTREIEVLRCLAHDMSPLEIAEALFISIHTVRRHRSNIMHKLNLKTINGLLKYAITKEQVA